MSVSCYACGKVVPNGQGERHRDWRRCATNTLARDDERGPVTEGCRRVSAPRATIHEPAGSRTNRGGEPQERRP